VPSEFNRKTFIDAGVEEQKIAVIPGCLNTRPFLKVKPRPANHSLSSSDPFRFISIFDWTLHKGWDVLLKAFLDAFPNRKDVILTLKVWSTMGYSLDTIKQQAENFILQNTSHTSLKDIPVEWVEETFSQDELLHFYTEADAFVLPSRGEGWGRPYMEAMACGLPVIGTGWSGNTAFMKEDNSYLIDYQIQPVSEIGWREIPTYRGHQWAQPDTTHLIQILQDVVKNRENANAIAQKGRAYILEHFDRKKVALQIQQELERISDQDSPAKSTFKHTIHKTGNTPIRLCWEGAQFSQHSLGLVNREITSRLLEDSSLEISLSLTESARFDPMQASRDAALRQHVFTPLSGEVDITVRHFYPPRLDPPGHGKFVLMQPWEYGYLPTAWIDPIRRHVDEIWCYSNYVKEVYLASGINKEMLHVIPLGVNTKIFHPEASPYIFTQEAGASSLFGKKHKSKPFTFLFVGGSLHRKGIDLLLNAYSKAFTALDEVCLIIKDTGTETVYRGGNERERILQLIQDNANASKPAMVYFDDDLSEHQLAGLYTASNCLVQPYRGEGFCLPALEAMACGIPVVVPRGGPTDDFVDDETGWRLDAERRPFGILPGQSFSRVGQWDCVGPTWQFEIDEDELARQLRYIYSHQNEASKRGKAAVKRAQDFTWENTAKIMKARLERLAHQPSQKISKLPAQKYFSDTASSREMLQRKPTLSLCMIVRDEERVLGDCLQSVRPWVDEIIIVDTGSTDRTVEIAKEHGVCVYHFPWCDDFSAARNLSIEHATGDWIFWMDADDTIPESCGSQLRTLIEQTEDRTTGYMMQVHIPPAPGENGFTIVDHVKLFRNLPQLRFIGRIHEQILEPIHAIGGRVERTDLYVVHSGYDNREAGQRKKRARDML
jgi:glycosyltransferase involved in cell wall biosynthesis